jgi:hypothetical protein
MGTTISVDNQVFEAAQATFAQKNRSTKVRREDRIARH